MKSFKLGLAQINSTTGDIKGNTLKILDYIKQAKKQKIDLVVFPELSVSGYLCMDLFLDHNFILKNLEAVEKIRKASKGITVVVGFVNSSDQQISGGFNPIYNAAILFQNGRKIGITHKVNLPDYDIFSEKRYFSAGSESKVFEINLNANKFNLGLQICEDIWDENYLNKPTQNQIACGAEIIINLSASPFWIGKNLQRENLILDKIKEFKIPIAMCNSVGSYDGYDGQIVFDGQSLTYNSIGQKLITGNTFSQELVVSSIQIDEKMNLQNEEFITQNISYKNEVGLVHKAITYSIKTYFEKIKFKKILVALSGGIDSSVVASLAVASVGKDKVEGILMPSRFTSNNSNNEALLLAHNLGIKTRTIPIQSSFEFLTEIIFETTKSKFEYFKKYWINLFRIKQKEIKIDLALENLQARIRANILMTISNRENALILNTSNKTESALGFGTLYGDIIGGLAPISDLNKLKVYEQGQYINKIAKQKIIPENVFSKAPTAELNLDQNDETSLGANYEILSPLVDALIEGELNQKTLDKKYGKKLVQQIQERIKNSEFKRRQSPPGIKLTKKSFGIGRRIPF